MKSVVNSLKDKELQTHMFRKICEDVDSLYVNNLYRT